MPDVVRKVCMCGDPGVGKTSLVRRFVVGKYDDKYISTLGTVISKKNVGVPAHDVSMTMLIWDISGQSEFKRIHASAFSNAAGGFVVCDATRPETMAHAADWIKTFRDSAGSDVPLVVLVNKSDLIGDDGGALKNDEGLNVGRCPILRTSARSGQNVEEAFRLLAKSIVEGAPIASGSAAVPAKIAVPEKFETPSALLDYMAIAFCNNLGDHEMGMHMLRKQVSDQGIDFHRMSRRQAEGLVSKLGELVQDFKGQQAASTMRVSMVRAIDRTKW